MMVPVGAAVTVDAPLAFDSEDGWDWDDTPTVTAYDALGVAMEDPAVGADPFAVTLNATDHTHRPDIITLTWAGDVDSNPVTVSERVEVVGSLLASLPDLRSTASTNAGGQFATADLIRYREECLDLIDEYRGWSPVRRLRLMEVPVWGCAVILDRDDAEVRGVTDTDGDVTFTQDGARVSFTASANVRTVAFVHGAHSAPSAAREACVEYVRASANAVASGVDRDAISVGYDGATTRYSTADWNAGRPTGMLRCDRLLNQLPDHRIPGIA